MIISPEKVQVLLAVAQRAPASLAEQIICQEVAAWMAESIAKEQQRIERKAAKATRRAVPPA